jgi:hypothetical protein
MKNSKSKVQLLRKKNKFGASRKQTLLALLGVVVALGGSFGVYSQYRATHASVYGTFVGSDNTWGEGLTAYACQTRSSGTNSIFVKATFVIAHGRAGNHVYYGGIWRLTGSDSRTYYSSGTAGSGYQTVQAFVTVSSLQNNSLGFLADYGPYAGYYNPRIISGTGWRPSSLASC